MMWWNDNAMVKILLDSLCQCDYRHHHHHDPHPYHLHCRPNHLHKNSYVALGRRTSRCRPTVFAWVQSSFIDHQLFLSRSLWCSRHVIDKMGIQEVSPQNLFWKDFEKTKVTAENFRRKLTNSVPKELYWLLFLLQKLGRPWWRIWRKIINRQHFLHPSLRALLHPYLSSCLPIAGGPTKMRGRFWFGCNQKVRGQSKNVGWKGTIRVVTWYGMTFMLLCRLKDDNVQNKLSNLLRKNAERKILSFWNLKFMQIVATCWAVAYLSGSTWEAKLWWKSSVNLPPNMFTL